MRLQTQEVKVNWDKVALDCERHMARNKMSERQMAKAIGVHHVLFWRFINGLTLLSADSLFAACDVMEKDINAYKLSNDAVQLSLFGEG